VAALALLCPPARAADDWKFDVVRLRNGKTFQGLVVGEGPAEIKFRCVRRNPGSPTVVITTTFQRQEVAGIDKLGDADREALEARLKALDPTGKDEAARMENLDLKTVPWLHKGDGDALCYTSAQFVLISNAREDIVRRAAVRLEQIYTAYGRFLPARHQGGKPTTIYLVRSLAEYQGLLREQGRDILNPAFYDAGKNHILCASDLQRMGDDLEQIRKNHQKILDDLKDEEAKLNKYYKGKVPATARDYINNKRQEIFLANQKNDRVFQQATRHLFRTLYHEAFHAYLANFVYPPEEYAVPRWLNEGLAQIFETAIVEAGELRVGHADPERLRRIRLQARKGQTVGLARLLTAGPQQFLVNHASARQVSDSFYLNSWALAFDLTFDRRLLGTPALDRYVQSLKHGADPLAAFNQLTGMPLEKFEADFQQYLLTLRPDGSTARLGTGK
jgi:hypothetical protein